MCQNGTINGVSDQKRGTGISSDDSGRFWIRQCVFAQAFVCLVLQLADWHLDIVEFSDVDFMEDQSNPSLSHSVVHLTHTGFNPYDCLKFKRAAYPNCTALLCRSQIWFKPLST